MPLNQIKWHVCILNFMAVKCDVPSIQNIFSIWHGNTMSMHFGPTNCWLYFLFMFYFLLQKYFTKNKWPETIFRWFIIQKCLKDVFNSNWIIKLLYYFKEINETLRHIIKFKMFSNHIIIWNYFLLFLTIPHYPEILENIMMQILLLLTMYK